MKRLFNISIRKIKDDDYRVESDNFYSGKVKSNEIIRKIILYSKQELKQKLGEK